MSEKSIGGGLVVEHHVQLDEVSRLVRPCRPIAGADREAIQPTVPGPGIAERTHVLPGEHERLLDRVLGAILVPQHETGDADQSGQ